MPTSLEKNEEFFKEQIERLQKALKGSYTKEQVNLLFNQIKRFKVHHLQETIEHLITMKTFLPPIGDVIAGCRTESYGDEREEDKDDAQFAKDLFEGKVHLHGKIAKDAMELISESFSGKITKHQLHQRMFKMDELYPGRGWRTEANKMMKKEEEKGE